MTMSSGLYSSFRLPTALAERMYSTPSIFMPKMLARKFSSDGSNRCPAPWRARNATRFPRSVPITYGPDGSPNGVVTACSRRSVTSAMSYRPLPPMMPIVTRSMHAPRRSRPGFRSLQHLLDRPLAVHLADVAGEQVRIVLEQDQVLAGDRLLD